MAKDKFKNRYVLGKGYPFYDGFAFVGLADSPNNEYFKVIELKRYNEVVNEDCPKYQLVLERVK